MKKQTDKFNLRRYDENGNYINSEKRDLPELKRKFIEILTANLGHFSKSAVQLGVNKSTLYDWCKQDKDFQKAIKDVDIQLIEMVESELYKKIKAGDTNAIIFFLKTKGKRRGWGDDKNSNKSFIINIPNFVIPQRTNDISDKQSDFQDFTEIDE